MLEYIKHNRQYISIIILWFVTGFFISPVLYILVPITIFFLSGKNKYLNLFLGFWIILIFSDARDGFGSAGTVKIIYILILFYFAYTKRILFLNNSYYKAFIPFFLVASVSWVFSPIPIESAQKTFSYFLIIFIIPPFVSFLLHTNKINFLLGLIYTGALFLLIGFLMWPLFPEFSMYAERFSGVFGNPNGLGIFTVLYTILWRIIKYNYPFLFSKKDAYLINGLILLSVIFAASRGALISVTMFYALDYSVRKKNPLIIVGVILVFVGFTFIDNIVAWLYSIGLGKYLRAQTLENGSGRLVAFEYAWERIQLNPVFGRGFGFSEYWFHLEDIQFMLNMENHQGGTHNTYLTIIMDTGFVGLTFFLYGWGNFFSKAIKYSDFGFPILIIILFSTNIEMWLSASLNPFTIILIIILTLLSNKNFLNQQV